MKQLLIPSGEITFHGTRAQLSEAFQKAGGVMEAEGKFRCTLPKPKQKGIQISFFHARGLILFQFLCEYESIPGGYRIRYRVMPTFFTWTLPVLLLALAIGGCRQFAGTELALYPLWIVSMVLPPVLLYFLWERTKQTEQFLAAFASHS